MSWAVRTSKESADQAARFIREARPHAVLLELCDGMVKARYIARG
jgi:pheromone shutdown protein TraB